MLVGSTLDSALIVEKLSSQSAVGVGVASNGNEEEEESEIKGSVEGDSGWCVSDVICDIIAVALTSVRRSIVTATRGTCVAMEMSVADRGAESLESSSPFPMIPKKI